MAERLSSHVPQLPKTVETNSNKYGAILGRPDLFETKFLELVIQTPYRPESRRVLCATRDPGSAAALIPVLKKLVERGDKIICATDGLAEEAIVKTFTTRDLTAQQLPVFATDLPEPNLILVDPSFSEFGLDTYVVAQYQDTPFVLVEDAYATANRFLTRLVQEQWRLPNKICVLDDVAKQIMVTAFPQLEHAMVITGQPAFDQFVHEPTQDIASTARQKLGIRYINVVVFRSRCVWFRHQEQR